MIGCDFGTANRSYPRSELALGLSPRNFDLPLIGRHGKTIYSTPELFSAAECFSNALNVYGASVASVASGIKLRDVDVDIVQLDDVTLNRFRNSSIFHDTWSTFVKSSDSQSTISLDRIECALNQYNLYSLKLKNVIEQSDCWNLTLARDLDELLRYDETDLEPSLILVRRLVSHPFSLVIQPLHDSIPENYKSMSRIGLKNIAWLDKVYTEYFNFLRKLVLDIQAEPEWKFSWQKLRQLLDS